MPNDLHDEIRDYAEWLDAAAPPIQELVPPLQTPKPRFVWVRGVVALAAVLLVGIPLALLFNRFGQGDDEPLSVAHITAAPFDGPVVLVLEGGGVSGLDHEPGLVVGVRMDGPSYPEGAVDLEPVEVRPDGRFDVEIPRGIQAGDTATVSAGDDVWVVTWIPIDLELLDPIADRVVGTAEVPDGTTVIIRIEGGSGFTWVETETFDGRWEAELGGLVDVTLEAYATAWVRSGDGFAAFSGRDATPRIPNLHLDTGGWRLQGEGFTPSANVEIRVDGVTVAGDVTASPGGRFDFGVGFLGLESGDTIEVVDGDGTRTIIVREVTATALDTDTWTVSGTTDLPDGALVRVWGGGTRRYIDATVTDGRFSATFAVPITSTNVEYVDEDGDTVAGTEVDGLFEDLPATNEPVGDSPSVSTAIGPTPFGGRVVAVNENRQVMGWGFAPGEVVGYTIRATVDSEGPFPGREVPQAALVAADGTFLAIVDVGWQGGDIITVDVGGDEFVIVFEHLNLDLFDADDGVAAGIGPVGHDLVLQIDDGDDVTTFETTITAEGWDLGEDGALPISAASVGTAWMEAGDGYVVTPPRTHADRFTNLEYSVDEGWLAGFGFLTNSPITIRIDGTPIGVPVRTALSGLFGFDLGGFGIEPGAVIEVSDGTTSRSITVQEMTVDEVEGEAVAGTATLPDASIITIEARSARVEHAVTVPVVGGEWSATFDTPGPYDSFYIRFDDGDGNALIWNR